MTLGILLSYPCLHPPIVPAHDACRCASVLMQMVVLMRIQGRRCVAHLHHGWSPDLGPDFSCISDFSKLAVWLGTWPLTYPAEPSFSHLENGNWQTKIIVVCYKVFTALSGRYHCQMRKSTFTELQHYMAYMWYSQVYPPEGPKFMATWPHDGLLAQIRPCFSGSEFHSVMTQFLFFPSYSLLITWKTF